MPPDNFNVSVSYELQINSIYVSSLDIQVVALLHKSVDMLCRSFSGSHSFSSFFEFSWDLGTQSGMSINLAKTACIRSVLSQA